MKKLMAAVAAAFALWMAVPSESDAQSQNCAPREMVVERLSEGFGESRQSVAIGANGAMVEVFANEETGTWSITVSMERGEVVIACLVASGQSYEKVDEPATPAGVLL